MYCETVEERIMTNEEAIKALEVGQGPEYYVAVGLAQAALRRMDAMDKTLATWDAVKSKVIGKGDGV
jgi:hypothetical protein